MESRAANASEIQTFLIADVRGYTRFTLEHGDAAAARLATRFAELTQEVVGSRDGAVIELRGDEALAVFSSARQALWAAVELQARYATESREDLPLRVGIGLDAGEAIPVKGGFRGAALNLAARLCSLAGPGEVLASDGVTHLARKVEGLTYDERGLVELKGFADSVPIVRVRAAADETGQPDEEAPEADGAEQHLPIGGFLGSLPSGPLVGRDAELEQVLQAVDAVGAGEGRLVMLAGEPGVGKTRLAQEVTLNLRNRRFLVTAGRAHEPQEVVPFYPFLEALAMLYDAAPRALRAEAGKRWPYLGQLLPDQIAIHPVATTGSGEDQQRLYRAVAAFVQVLAEETPVALLLDDLHWADQSSLDLLLYLARQTRSDRVLLLGTYRDVEVGRQHPLERALRDLHRDGLLDEVSVRRLDEAGTAALAATAFGEEEISAEFADLLFRHTEGNPFFTQEVLRALVERGDIYREGDRWERRAVAEIEVPKSVRSAVGERLSRLTEEAQEALYEASVLGQGFAFDDLLALSERKEDELERLLEEALAARLIREAGRDGYAFNHALTQQALYGELSARRKRRLHLAAGEALEELPGRKREPRVAELAWHFLEADEPEKAARYSLLAGDRAEAVFAHGEAERHYRTAVEMAADIDDEALEAEALARLGQVLTVVARYREAIEVLEKAARWYRSRGDRDREAEVVAAIGRNLARVSRYDEAMNRVQPLLTELESGGASHALALLAAARANVLFAASRQDEQLRAAEYASRLAREIGDEALLLQSEVERGTALGVEGRSEEAIPVLTEAVLMAEEWNDLRVLQRALNNLASNYWEQLRYDEAYVYHKRMLVVAEQLGDPSHIGWARTMVSVYDFMWGTWDRSLEELERAIAVVRPLGASHAAFVLALPAWILALRGQYEAGSRILDECLELADQWGDARLRIVAIRLRAVLNWQKGNLREARAQAERALSSENIRSDDRADALAVLTGICLDTGDLTDAEEALRELGRSGIEGQTFMDQLALKAILLARSERLEEAQQSVEQALALTRRIRYRFGEGWALLAQGEILQRLGDLEAARDQLRAARDVFEALQARPSVERVEKMLAAL